MEWDRFPLNFTALDLLYICHECVFALLSSLIFKMNGTAKISCLVEERKWLKYIAAIVILITMFIISCFKTEKMIKCNTFLWREKFSNLPAPNFFINAFNNLFCVCYDCFMKNISSHYKWKFIKELFKSIGYATGRCLEFMNTYLDIGLLHMKKMVEICFPYRRFFIVKVEFNTLDFSFKFRQ